MRSLVIPARGRAREWNTDEPRPEDGVIWLDFERESEAGWADECRRLLDISVHENHVRDSLNVEHPSYFESTPEYEMIVIQGLSPDASSGQLSSRPTVFFLGERTLVTIRPADSVSIAPVRERLLEGKGRLPRQPASLTHAVVSRMIDRFLALRPELNRQLETWQRELLDPDHPFDDWRLLMKQRSSLRTVESLCEGQESALVEWKDETRIELSPHMEVLFRDVIEHVQRVQAHGLQLRQELESLVQMHFSATAHRTNEIVRVLTVVSAVFLPLTFVAGVLGMNFVNIPGAEARAGFWVAVVAMTLAAVVLVLLFRRRRWL